MHVYKGLAKHSMICSKWHILSNASNFLVREKELLVIINL